MSDKDDLPARGIPAYSLVDENGVSTDGTSASMNTIRSRGMQPICEVNSSGVAASSSTMNQLRSRGIRFYCAVTENAVTSDAVTLDTLRSRGIPFFCPVDVNGIAVGGTATIKQLAAKGLPYACLLDSSGSNGPTLNLSASTFPENSALNTVIGVLSVTGGTGTYTYTFTSNPGTLFNISGSNLRVTSTTIAAGSYPVTIRADNGAGSVIDKAFLLTATAVVGGTNFTAVRISHLQW